MRWISRASVVFVSARRREDSGLLGIQVVGRDDSAAGRALAGDHAAGRPSVALNDDDPCPALRRTALV